MSRRKLPRNTAAVIDAAILAKGEVAFDVTNDELRTGDGEKLGGISLSIRYHAGKRSVAIGRGAWEGEHGEINFFAGENSGRALKAGTGGLNNAKGIVGVGANVLADGVGGYNDDFGAFGGMDAMRYATGGYCGAGWGLRIAHVAGAGSSYFSAFGCDVFLNATYLQDAHAVGSKPALGRASVVSSLLFGSAAPGGGSLTNVIAFGGGCFDNFGSMAINNIANQIGIGRYSLRGVQQGAPRTVAIGDFAGAGANNQITGGYGFLGGHGTGSSLTSAIGYVHIGDGAGGGHSSAYCNMTFGLNSSAQNFTNSIAFGGLSLATADNQLRTAPGMTITTDNPVAVTSDANDKTDIQDNVLGLDFLDQFRIVSYIRDLRALYFETTFVETEVEEEYDELVETGGVAKTDDGNVIPLFKSVKKKRIVVKTVPQKTPVPRDGRFKGTRRHLGVIAQEVAEICKRLGIDFAAVQHHAVSGGDDVWSFVYEQLILVNCTAIQQLHRKHKALEARFDALQSQKMAKAA
jgi:hypothetical protein